MLSLEQIAFHLLEEVGEVAAALQACYRSPVLDGVSQADALEARLLDLEEELADVISWLFAIALKIRRLICGGAVPLLDRLTPESSILKVCVDLDAATSLSEIVWARYGRTPDGEEREHLFCPACGDAPCRCDLRSRVPWLKLHE